MSLLPPAAPELLGGWPAILASYLLGAVPFGLLVARVVGGVDPRTVGSGNIGATNTARALGRKWGLVTFGLDVAKGVLPVLVLAPAMAGDADLDALRVACGLAAVVGHCFPVWLRFHGGKGVATAAGMVIGLEPVVFLIGGGVWLAGALVSRFVSLSSMLMSLGFVAASAWREGATAPLTAGLGALAILVLFKHRANVQRILSGDEPRLLAGRTATQESGS